MSNDILTEQIYKAYCENYTSFKKSILNNGLIKSP